MKKLFLLFIFLLSCISYGSALAYDQEFSSVRLRYGYQYNFFDTFHSAPTKRSGINSVTTTFTERADYNGGGNPTFLYTPTLVSAGYVLNAGQSMNIVEASSSYPISYHPVSRGVRDLEIVYAIRYYEETSPGVWAGPYTHTQYQPYEITWCGDGVRDNYTDVPTGTAINEQCDPNDASRSGWGTGGCSATCTPITIPTPPTCSSLSMNPVSGTTPLTSNAFCTGINATSTSINCGNGQVINGNSGTCTYNAAGTFTAICNINGNITSPACQRTITVSTPPVVCGNGVVDAGEQCDDGNANNTDACSNTCTTNGGNPVCGNGVVDAGEQCDDGNANNNDSCRNNCTPPGGGGSSGPNCTQIQIGTTTLVSPNRRTNITCSGNSQALRFRIDCGNGQEVIGNGSIVVGQPGMHFTGVCDYASSSTGTLFTPSCFAGGASGIPSNGALACTDRLTLTDGPDGGGGGGGSGVCGDGVIQRPNSNGQMEQCERLIVGGFPSFCNSATCTVDFSTTPTECVVGACPITIPSEGEILFGPAESIVIGNGMNPFSELSVFPYVYNGSSYDLFLDDLCVTNMVGNTLSGNDTQCASLGLISPGERVQFSALPTYLGNIANIPAGQSYSENVLGITVRNEGTLYDWAYFTQPFDVRVARPSVATTGGGTSFISGGATTNRLSNISNIASGLTGFETEDNKNFVGTSVSDLSSYSKDDLDTSVRDTVEADGTNFVEDVNTSLSTSTATVGAIATTTLISEFGSYNGIENVYVLNGKNFKLGSTDLVGLSGPRTYIINNGNLEIEGNVSYPDNIAFVVKGGNIIIDNVVSNITGVYISIPLSGVGGDIKGTSGSTNTVLTVDGSLYGDISDLSLKRTYIRDTGSQISVGTIVSFASGLFRRPAPLVSQFIEEYMTANKIAK